MIARARVAPRSDERIDSGPPLPQVPGDRCAPRASDLVCPRCAAHPTDECPQCRGEHTIAVRREPVSIALPVSTYAVERVQSELRLLLVRTGIIGADDRARRLARTLTCPPAGADVIGHVRDVVGCSPAFAERVLRVVAGALEEHAIAVEAAARYSRERLPAAQREARHLCALAARLTGGEQT
jgi:hypothetical protein